MVKKLLVVLGIVILSLVCLPIGIFADSPTPTPVTSVDVTVLTNGNVNANVNLGGGSNTVSLNGLATNGVTINGQTVVTQNTIQDMGQGLGDAFQGINSQILDLKNKFASSDDKISASYAELTLTENAVAKLIQQSSLSATDLKTLGDLHNKLVQQVNDFISAITTELKKSEDVSLTNDQQLQTQMQYKLDDLNNQIVQLRQVNAKQNTDFLVETTNLKSQQDQDRKDNSSATKGLWIAIICIAFAFATVQVIQIVMSKSVNKQS